MSGRTVGNALAARALMIVLTVWALAMIAPALYRVVAPLNSIGLSVDNDGRVLDVRHPFETANTSPAELAGILPGERLDFRRMQCRNPFSASCSGVVAVLGDFGGVQYVWGQAPVTLAILPAHGGPPVIMRLTPRPAPQDWEPRFVLLLDTVVGILFVGVAFRLVWTRPSPMTWGFFLYAIWFNPGQDYTYYALLQSWTPAVLIEQCLEAFAQGAAYAGLIAFALRFPGDAVEPQWRRLAALLPWLGAAITILVLVGGLNLFGVPTEAVSRIQFFAIIPLDALAILLLLLRARHLPPQDEARMRWAIAGCAIGLPAFLAAELCQSTGLPYALFGANASQTLIGLLYLFHGVIAYFVGTAVRRRRVVSVAIPLRRGAILAVLTFMLGVPIVYLHDQLSHLGGSLNEHYDLPEWVWLLVISPIALIALTQLHHHSVEMTERVFNRRYHRARERLIQAGQTILTVRNFEDIDRLLTELPAQTLRLSSVAVFRAVDGTLQRCGPAVGWADAGLSRLDDALDALPLTCLRTGRPHPLPRGSWTRPGLPQDDQMPCLAVPIRGGATEAVAILLFGPHVTGSDINRDEQELLRDFAERAALGYDRVEVENLRRELAGLRATVKSTFDRSGAAS
jgi:hypothetical protein